MFSKSCRSCRQTDYMCFAPCKAVVIPSGLHPSVQRQCATSQHAMPRIPLKQSYLGLSSLIVAKTHIWQFVLMDHSEEKTCRSIEVSVSRHCHNTPGPVYDVISLVDKPDTWMILRFRALEVAEVASWLPEIIRKTC